MNQLRSLLLGAVTILSTNLAVGQAPFTGRDLPGGAAGVEVVTSTDANILPGYIITHVQKVGSNSQRPVKNWDDFKYRVGMEKNAARQVQVRWKGPGGTGAMSTITLRVPHAAALPFTARDNAAGAEVLTSTTPAILPADVITHVRQPGSGANGVPIANWNDLQAKAGANMNANKQVEVWRNRRGAGAWQTLTLVGTPPAPVEDATITVWNYSSGATFHLWRKPEGGNWIFVATVQSHDFQGGDGKRVYQTKVGEKWCFQDEIFSTIAKQVEVNGVRGAELSIFVDQK